MGRGGGGAPELLRDDVVGELDGESGAGAVRPRRATALLCEAALSLAFGEDGDVAEVSGPRARAVAPLARAADAEVGGEAAAAWPQQLKEAAAATPQQLHKAQSDQQQVISRKAHGCTFPHGRDTQLDIYHSHHRHIHFGCCSFNDGDWWKRRLPPSRSCQPLQFSEEQQPAQDEQCAIARRQLS